MLSCKRTAGCTYAGVVPSSTSSPLKPGCWLLILCSYINMLSSRGQRWAHTELSCCQVNTEVDVKSCRKVEHGEAGRGTLNMRELRMRSSGRKVSVVWNDRDCTQNTCGSDKSDWGGVSYLFIYCYYLLHLLAKIKQVRAGLLPCIFTYIPPVLQRAQRSTASKKRKNPKPSSGVTADPKIAPARTNARLLNTLLQHCYWTNTDMCSIHTDRLPADVRCAKEKNHTHKHEKDKYLHITVLPLRWTAKDIASADYSQQTRLRFMVLSQLRQGCVEGGKKPGERKTELTVGIQKKGKK